MAVEVERAWRHVAAESARVEAAWRKVQAGREREKALHEWRDAVSGHAGALSRYLQVVSQVVSRLR